MSANAAAAAEHSEVLTSSKPTQASPDIIRVHREDILRAAIAEFGKAGYAAASTNEIVKNAKVSKGLLFHHFTNKEKLYTACQLHVMMQYGQFMTKRVHFTSPDLFDRILESLRIKMEFGCKNPEFLALTNRVWYMEDDNSILKQPEAEASIMKIMQEYMAAFFNGVDTTKFREGLELAKVMDYTRLAMEASWARFSHRHGNDTEAIIKDIDSYFTEAKEILSLLKYGVYEHAN